MRKHLMHLSVIGWFLYHKLTNDYGTNYQYMLRTALILVLSGIIRILLWFVSSDNPIVGQEIYLSEKGTYYVAHQ